MANKIIGDLQVSGTVTSLGKTVAVSVNGTPADANGNIQVEIYNREEILNMFGILPLTRYGEINSDPIAVSNSGFVFNIDNPVQVFMAGKFATIDAFSIDLSTVSSPATNKTFYVYVQSVQGLFQYTVSTTEIVETFTNCFIGTITTDGTGITANTIQKVTRLDIYRPSSTAKGSAIPVSTGLPSQPGSIGW